MNYLGNFGEAYIKALLENRGIKCVKSTYESRYEYDYSCQFAKTKFTLEVKLDAKSFETGNIPIETHNTKSDKPSGLNCTQADIWCFLLKDFEHTTAWFANTEQLRTYVKTNEPFKTVEFGGDKNARLLLYRADDILKSVFTKVDTLDEEGLKKLIKKLVKSQIKN